jgi:hypothetical protein
VDKPLLTLLTIYYGHQPNITPVFKNKAKANGSAKLELDVLLQLLQASWCFAIDTNSLITCNGGEIDNKYNCLD